MDKDKVLKIAVENDFVMVIADISHFGVKHRLEFNPNRLEGFANAIESALREEYSLQLATTIDQLRLMEIQLDTILSNLDKR